MFKSVTSLISVGLTLVCLGASVPAAAEEREQALALYVERCTVGADSVAAQLAPQDYDRLVQRGYTESRILQAAQRLPQDCQAISFDSAIAVIDPDPAIAAGVGGVGESPAAEPAWRASARRRLAVHSLFWIMPFAITDGACRGVLISAGQDLGPFAAMPYLIFGTISIPMAITVYSCLGSMTRDIERFERRRNYVEHYRRRADITAGVALACFLVGTVTSLIAIPTGMIGLFVVGAHHWIASLVLIQAAATMAVVADDVAMQPDGVASRRRPGSRLVAWSPLGVMGVW